ncbi:MAG: hypothetical protein IPL59_02100 [Candidatus Competibacteraceae bacterium]|nr:hypothetical protein [Candidatus Competibacteraceae bacterium]
MVEVQGHILPHHDRLESGARTSRRAEGWTLQQGFYVYRNARRCWSDGGWQDWARTRSWTREAHRLARITPTSPALMPTGKSTFASRQPARRSPLRKQLLNLAEDIRQRRRDGSLPAGADSPVGGRTPREAWQAERGNGVCATGLAKTVPLSSRSRKCRAAAS